MARTKTPRGGNPISEIAMDEIVLSSEVYQKAPKADKALNADVKKNGLKTPVIVLQEPDQPYAVIVGGRRLDAAKRAGMDAIPAGVVRGFTSEEIALLHLVSNQYSDDGADPLERMGNLSKAADVVSRKFALQPRTWLDMPTILAAVIGFSRSFVTMELRMQAVLPPSLKAFYATGLLSRTSAYTVSGWDYATIVLFEEILGDARGLERKHVTDIVHELDQHPGSEGLLAEAMRWLGYASRLCKIDNRPGESEAIERLKNQAATITTESISYGVTSL